MFSKLVIAGVLVLTSLVSIGQGLQTSDKDLNAIRIIIDSLDKKGAEYFLKGDSMAMYRMYAKDADLGGITGKEILKYWGTQIRNSIKNDTRNMKFTISTLSTDGEFVTELGTYEIKDSKNNLKATGKYLIVWKQEDGNWKLYRDIPL